MLIQVLYSNSRKFFLGFLKEQPFPLNLIGKEVTIFSELCQKVNIFPDTEQASKSFKLKSMCNQIRTTLGSKSNVIQND